MGKIEDATPMSWPSTEHSIRPDGSEEWITDKTYQVRKPDGTRVLIRENEAVVSNDDETDICYYRFICDASGDRIATCRWLRATPSGGEVESVPDERRRSDDLALIEGARAMFAEVKAAHGKVS